MERFRGQRNNAGPSTAARVQTKNHGDQRDWDSQSINIDEIASEINIMKRRSGVIMAQVPSVSSPLLLSCNKTTFKTDRTVCSPHVSYLPRTT